MDANLNHFMILMAAGKFVDKQQNKYTTQTQILSTSSVFFPVFSSRE